jgi:glycine oxidase
VSEAPSIAIAGGGVIGLCAAWRLAQRGWRVSVFDQGTMGGEASWASAGMLAVGGEIDERNELADLALASRRLYPDFIRELVESSGFAIDFQETGALDLAYSAEELATLEARAARQSALGIISESVALERVAAFWPGLRIEGLAGARFYPGDGVVNPRQLVIALCAVCGNLGVRFVQQCAVRKIAGLERGVEIASAVGVETYSAALIAAGAWSSSIEVKPIPVPGASPVKGHLIGYQQPERTCPTIIRRGHSYLLQRASGLVVAGASVEHAGFDRHVDTAIVSRLAADAGFVLPHLIDIPPTETWIGFRPASDELHIGRWHSSQIYLAYGHYRNGILLAPLTAYRLANEISANLEMR